MREILTDENVLLELMKARCRWQNHIPKTSSPVANLISSPFAHSRHLYYKEDQTNALNWYFDIGQQRTLVILHRTLVIQVALVALPELCLSTPFPKPSCAPFISSCVPFLLNLWGRNLVKNKIQSLKWYFWIKRGHTKLGAASSCSLPALKSVEDGQHHLPELNILKKWKLSFILTDRVSNFQL